MACNSHENAIAGIGNRHYAEKYAEFEYKSVAFKNQIGNPCELIRRAVHAVISRVIPAILDIDEEKIKRCDTEVMDIPQSEIVSELHGKSIFPIHKIIDDIAPGSFTEQMKKDNYEAASGTELPKFPPSKAFVKPNEALGKIKPRLIQHTGPQGTAASSLMNKTIEQMFFRLPYFVHRSIKGTDNSGVSERIRQFFNDYKAGGFASTDFGSFDSSVTDKCTGDTDKPGLRRIIEEAIVKAIIKKFPDAYDFKNVDKARWKKRDRVLFDTITLLTEVLIRHSGDGLTSVGNFAINWTVDRAIDFALESIFSMWDMRQYSLEEVLDYLTHLIDEPQFIKDVLERVAAKAERLADTITRVSKGQHVTKEDSEFLNGEGDDRVKGFRWAFIQRFETKDKKNKDARESLGVMTSFMYTLAGMSLEPQDRTGRVSAEKLIDKSQRIEYISRIFVPIQDGKAMRSFPKLRKTFAAATVTFNVNDPFLTAAATKMLSIMMMCEQCPLQFPFYSLIFRFYQHQLKDDTIITTKRKYEWWELKLIYMISDNGHDGGIQASCRQGQCKHIPRNRRCNARSACSRNTTGTKRFNLPYRRYNRDRRGRSRNRPRPGAKVCLSTTAGLMTGHQRGNRREIENLGAANAQMEGPEHGTEPHAFCQWPTNSEVPLPACGNFRTALFLELGRPSDERRPRQLPPDSARKPAYPKGSRSRAVSGWVWEVESWW